MRISEHIILSAVLAIAFIPIFGIGSIFIFLSGFLLDVDHMLFYWWIKGFDWNILRMVRQFPFHQKRTHGNLLVGHTMEFLMITFMISFYANYWPIFIGIMFHIMLDISAVGRESYQFSLIQWSKLNLIRS